MKSYIRSGRLLASIFLSTFSLVIGQISAQTTLINPAGAGGFELGSTFAANGWTVVNGSGVTNQWFVGTVPPLFPATNSAYISNDIAGATHNYDIAAGSLVHFYRDVTLPAGETNIAYGYQWVAQGESTYDFIQVSIGSTSIVPVAMSGVAGSVTITNPLIPGTTVIGAHNLQGAVQTVSGNFSSAVLGNCNAPVTVRVFFTWRNDGSAGTQPPGALDNISLVSSTPAGAPLAGVVPVGPTGAYATLTAAVNAINTQGVSAPVFLELQAAYTSAGETFPITLGGAGSCSPLSAANTVTIRPEAGATALSIVGTNAGPTIDINNGQWWRIDGRPGGAGSTKELTVSNTSTSGQAVRFINEGSNNIIRYTTLAGVNTSTVSGVVLFSTTTGANGNDNNLIDLCDIRDGATTPVNCIYGSGTSTTAATYNSGNTISNNNIFNYFHATSAHNGINLTTANTEFTITGNSFYQTSTRSTTATVSAILLSSSVNNGFVITNNFIGGTTFNAGGSAMTYIGGTIFRGMQITVGTTIATSIQNNTIQNISVTSTSTSTAQSAMSLLTGNINCGNITGNTIGSQSANGSIVFGISGSAAIASGILAGTGTPGVFNISNNTIGGMTLVVNGAPATAPNLRGISFQGTAAGHTYLVSNNTVGSPSTANSLQTDINGGVIGIFSGSNSLGQVISNNTVANLRSNGTGTTGTVIGIQAQGSSGGTYTITGNTVRDLSSTNGITGTGGTASILGINHIASAATTGSNLIQQNTVHSLANVNASAATSVTGMVFNLPTATTNTVARNFVHSLSLSSSTVTGTIAGLQVNGGTTTYQNNMVRLGIDAAGADITGAYNINAISDLVGTNNYYFNSVYVGGAGVGAGAGLTFAFNSAVTVNNRNFISNIFVNQRSNGASTGKHYAINVGGTAANPAGLNSNYNDLWATGTGGFTGRFNAIDQATIADWRTATGQDFNSFSADPKFLTPTGTASTVDLHISDAVATPVEGAGQGVPSITDDFDGQTRANLTPVDMGADGGNFIASDISAPGISYTNLANSCGNGDVALNGVNITDATGIPLAGNLIPRIYYRKNADAYVSRPGVFQSGTANNSNWNFNIVAADMGGVTAADVISYYVIAQDNSATPNVGSNPGGVVATDVNTITTHPAAPRTYTVLLALSGTYTVGAGGNFATLTAAVTAYNTGCLAGPVVFSLTDATYTTPAETFPITINQGNGASATNTLTIRPAAGNTASVTGSAAALIKLNGADYVTIDGSNDGTNSRNLSFINTITTTSAVLWNASIGGAGNGANNNTLKNLIVTGGIGTTSGVYGIVSSASSAVGTAGDDNDNFRVENCVVSKVYNAISNLASTTPALAADGLVITQNVIGDAVLANYVTNRGIEVNNANSPSITQNTIFNIITSASISNAAIDLGANVIGGEVLRNNITKVYSTSSGGWGAYGINFSTTTGTTGVLVANNMIADVLTSNYSSSTTFNAFGIRLAGGTNIKVYNNSVNMFGTPTTGTSSGTISACFLVTTSSVTGADVRNNIFRNTQSFLNASNAYSVYLVSGVTLAVSNNNDYYGVSSGNTVYNVGYNGSNQTTLANWQAFTGQDGSSTVAEPVFVSPTDLHLTNNLNQCLDGGGAPLAAVPADFDDQARNASTPDIGADEFTNPDLALTVTETSGTGVNDNIACAGATVTLTAAGGASYNWSTNSTDNPLVVNPTTTTTYTVTITNGACTDVLSATITVDPLPAAFTVTGGGEYCAPGAGVPVGLSGSETGVNYELQLNGSGTGNVLPGTGAALAFGNQATAGNYTVLATNTATTCTASMTGSATVTANQIPNAFSVTGGGSYCAPGAGVPVGLAGSETGVDYQLQNNGSDIGAPVAGTGAALAFGNQTASGNYTVIATRTLGGCTAAMSSSATVNANPAPVLSETVVEPTTCTATNGSIDLTVSAASGPFTYNWSTPNGSGLVNGQEDQSGLGVGTYFVTVTATGTGCSATRTISLAGPGGCDACPVIATLSAAPAGVCVNVSSTLTASGLVDMGITYGITFKYFDAPTMTPYSGGTVIATIPNGSLTNNFTVATTSTSFATGGTYYIYAILDQNPTDPACRPFAQTVLTVVNTPNVNAVANQTVCTGSATAAVNFSGNVPGTIFNWTNSNTGIGLAASGSGDIASFAAANATTGPITATITVTPVTSPTTGAECTGAPITFTITVNPVPQVNAVSSQTYCTGASVPSVAFTSNVPGAVFSWSRTNEAIGLGANSGTGNVPAFTAANAGATPLTSTFSVVASFTSNGVTCTGTPVQFSITVNPTPTVAAVSNQIVCNGAATTAVTFSGTATSFNWTNNNAGIGLAASGSGNIASFTATNAGGAPVVATITVTPVYLNNGVTCTGTPTAFTITVNPTAQVNQPANLTTCGGANTTVNFTTTTPGTTYTWTNSNTAIGLAAGGTGNISFVATTVAVSTTATITVTPNYTNAGVSCPGTPKTFTITVDPLPTVNAVPSQTWCSGEATTAVSFSGSIAGTVFNWTNNNPSIGLAASGTGNIASFVTTNTSTTVQVATITVTPVLNTTGGSCPGTATTFTITVYPRPIVNVGADQVICQNQTATLTALLGGGATGGSWTGGAGVYGDKNSANSSYTPAASEYGTTITLTFTSNDPAGPCPAVSDALQLTVNTLPIVNAGSDAKVCDGDVLTLSTLGATITANGSGISTGSWSTSGTGNFLPNNSFPGALTYAPSAADYAKGFVTLTLISGDPVGPCSSVSDAIVLTFKGQESVVCNDNVQVSLDPDGIAVINPDMVLEGSFDDDFFTVDVYQNNVSFGNTVNCTHVGKTFQVRVTDNCTGNFCWGTIKVEDKLAPVLTCTDVHLICAVTNYEPAYLFNTLNIQNAYPAVAENCPPATLTFVDDWFDLDCDAQYSARILRKWTAVDASGNKGTCTQNIYLDRRHVTDVLFPADVTISCNSGGVNTTPSATGAPYLVAFGRNWPVFPNAGNCEMQSAYVDQNLPVCDGTVKILRTWTVYDWCLPTSPTPPTNPSYYIQVIKVVDDQGPTLACPANITVSTDPFNCCGTPNLPDVIVEDACSRINSASARVVVLDPETGVLLNTYDIDGALTNFAGNNLWAPDTLAEFGYTPCLSMGVHTVTYTMTDDCGNTSTCSYRLTVDDATPPVAACDEFTQVGLGGDGMAFINASTFDDGSYDNCSAVHFKARRMNDNDCQDSDFFYDQVKFCCEDINDTILVVFRVYDVDVDAGDVSLTYEENNANDCMVQVFVEDKIKPICTAPAHTTVTCENFDPSLWAYGFATAVDNCCIDTITVTNNLGLFDTVCNKGTITRTFRAIDCGGQSSTCTQRIIVTYEQDYYVKFPNDVIVTVCDGTGNYGEPTFFGEDCELLGVSHEDEIFTVVPDACFKIERTWTIINWCTYNPNLGCINVPNPNPNATVNHPSNLPGPTVSAAGTPAPWNPTVVAINPGQTPTNYSTFWAANANCYKYKQIIKVIDTQDPVVQCPASPVEVCDLTPNDGLLWNEMYWYDATINSHDLCEAPTDLCITATDLCSGANVNFRYLLFLDLDGDGTMESVVNSINTGIAGLGWNAIPYGNAVNPNYAGGTIRQFDGRPVLPNQKYGFALQVTTSGTSKTACLRWNTQQSQNTYVIPELPYGTHKIKWFIEDGCGNETICEYTFVVKDCKKPTVVCINGLSVNIMPTKMIALWDTDFLQYTEDNCTPSTQLKTAIRKSGTGTGFPLNPDGTPQKSVVFTCDELGTQLVELWSVDAAGNADYCETYVIVQDNAGICSGNAGTVAGALKTEAGNGLEDAQVGLSGQTPGIPPAGGTGANTDENGNYLLAGLPFGSDYTITPMKDNDPLNGVSTFDLVLINKHILGLEPLNTPFRMIAADANNSRSITTFDIVELRKLILGIYTELPNNTSWRFVDEAYQFPNASNPFQEIFPETVQLADLQGDKSNIDFVSVKVGDVNGNAVTSSLLSVDDRTDGTLLFDVTPIASRREVKAGEQFTLTFRAAEKVAGYQFTLYFPNLEVLEVTPGAEMTTGNFGIFAAEHALTTSFNQDQVAGEFTVTFRATAAGEISKMLAVSSRITKAEAYNLNRERQAIALRFNGDNTTITGLGFELYQNAPNPWLSKTQIGFYLPEATAATLTVFDETGRTLFTQTGDYSRGYNAVTLDRSVLRATGVLYYKVETANDSAVKKMIQVK